MIKQEYVTTHRQRALSPDHPVIRGTSQNPDVYFQGRESVNTYYAEMPLIVEQIMDRFADLTGRRYGLFEYLGAADAERVIILMGSGIGATEEAVETLVARGEKVGLIGRSGAGKSTLVKLLLRFYDAESGRILIDGQDIARVTQDSLRASIGMVTQDSSLLHRSVRANILYGRPDASEAEMIAAAREPQAHDFILGHLKIELAIAFGIFPEGKFSDGALLAIGQTDMRRLFNALLIWGLAMSIVGAALCWILFG